MSEELLRCEMFFLGERRIENRKSLVGYAQALPREEVFEFFTCCGICHDFDCQSELPSLSRLPFDSK